MKLYLLGLLVLAVVAAGYDEPNVQRRILEDNFAEPGDFPFQVAVILNDAKICGGSIISDLYILTAAHCVVKAQSPDEVTVYHGSAYWRDGIKAEVSEVIVHENFGNFKNDVALLKLATPLAFDRFTKPVWLHNRKVPTGATVFISGFGGTYPGDEPSEDLKFAKMTVLSAGECARQTVNYNEGVMCVNGPRGTGMCFGDSGGPAVYNGELVGVASFVLSSKACGTALPDAYSKVFYFLDWIVEHSNVF